MIKYPRPIKTNDIVGITATSSGVVLEEDKLKDSSIEIGKKITLNYSLDDKEKTIIIDLL